MNDSSKIKPISVFGNLTEPTEQEVLDLVPPDLHEKIKEHFKLMRGEIADLKRKSIKKN